jgi:hypothetical protein
MGAGVGVGVIVSYMLGNSLVRRMSCSNFIDK